MNQVISYIVENQLLSGAVVNLPQIGIFQIERQSARLTPDGMGIESPWEVLSFYSRVSEDVELTRDSIYSHLESYMQQSIAGYNFESAKVGYQEWINEVYADVLQPIDLEGVCRLVYLNGVWELSDIDDSFAALLLEPDQEPLALSVEGEFDGLDRGLRDEWTLSDGSAESVEGEVVYSVREVSGGDISVGSDFEIVHSVDEISEASYSVQQSAQQSVSQSALVGAQGDVVPANKGVRSGNAVRFREERVPKSSPIGLIISILALLAAVGYLAYSYMSGGF